MFKYIILNMIYSISNATRQVDTQLHCYIKLCKKITMTKYFKTLYITLLHYLINSYWIKSKFLPKKHILEGKIIALAWLKLNRM